MNGKLKSLFIMPAIGASILLMLVAMVMAVIGENERTAWLGATIASVPLPLLFLRLTLAPIERTSENLPLLLLIASFGVLVASWEQFLEGTSGWGPTSVALCSAIIFLVYVFWYSRFGRIESYQLAVGSKLPEFSLPDAGGNQFDSTSLEGSPVIVLFYRGNWCPLCMAQVNEVAQKYRDIENMGIKVVLISPQPESQTRVLAERHQVPFNFLVDADNKFAESLGIAVSDGVPAGIPGDYPSDTVLPTLIVTNDAGTIVYSDQTDNYRVRPEPDIFLAILRRTGAIG